MLNCQTARVVIGDDEIEDATLAVLLTRAQKEALNHYYWKTDDIPTDDEIAAFTDKYEFEIYDIAKAMSTDNELDGMTSYSELGVTRTWGSGADSKTAVRKALSEIPKKVYVL